MDVCTNVRRVYVNIHSVAEQIHLSRVIIEQRYEVGATKNNYIIN